MCQPDGGFVALQLMGDALPESSTLEVSDTLLLLFNAGSGRINFPLESTFLAGTQWTLALDSSSPDAQSRRVDRHYNVQPMSVAVLTLHQA